MADKIDAKYLQELLKYQKKLNNSMGSAINIQDKIRINEELISNEKRIQNEYENASKLSKKEISNLTNDEQKLLNDIINKEKSINSELDKQIKRRQNTVNLAKLLTQQLKIGWKYLQDQDKIIKSTNLSLGMSGAKAVAMRDAFEKSAGYVTRLGGTIGDIQSVMQGYADETGRARVMSAEMVKDITNIGKGTTLGIENATKLGAQFELMGYDARRTMEFVQGVVDTTERMGVNTTKVLKVVNDNFKKLNTYTFQQGVKGFAEMASYAEKFKIDISDALNAADVARSLEGAIDLAAQLQVMGGEFAKTDPFEMLFLSRNDPAKFTEKIADMTKGVVSFRKVTDSAGKTVFEKFISPADRDRLAAVAKSLGMEASALTEIAQRQAEIQKMRQQMSGLGLSKEQKEIIEGAAHFDTKSGKFQVQLGQTMHNIGELTSKQAEKFKVEQKLLEERAKQAMTFDETFKATIETLKASLLPLLKQVNWLLDHTIKPIADLASKGWGVGGAAVALISAALVWKGVTNKLGNVVSKWVQNSGGKGIAGAFGKVNRGGSLTETLSTQGSESGLFEQRKGIGMGAAAKGQGMESLGKGVGIGAAGAGVGAGIMMGAKGIGELAQAIKNVDVDKLKVMNGTIAILGVTMVGILVPAIFAMGGAGTAGAVGLLAVGAAAVGIGFGINLATKGIGKMSEGIAKMNKTGGGAGKELLAIAGGIGAITVAMAGGGILGIAIFNRQLKKMNENIGGIQKIGAAFANIEAVLSGSKDDFIAVQNAVTAIGNTNIKSGGMFSELAKLLKNPLQVEFKDKNVAVVSNITMEIDGKKLFNQSYSVSGAVQKEQNLRHNKGDLS